MGQFWLKSYWIWIIWVFGTSRDSSICNKFNLENLGIISKINLLSMNLSDYRSVINVLKEVRPDQIYNLEG